MGCLLVKPDMGHIRTEPNIFVPGETYVPVRWDFSDLPEVCARYLADDVARKAITARAYQVLADYYRSHNALQRFDEILTLAGTPSAASAAAAMQQRAKHNV
jgi:spore maturation protein CgeB